ncbi:MAG: hypothetical protein PHN49_06910 [Candidatus Omnitrophica bacterium]|nr:hypothetical protein [Candidatus Omnitrophota bacterium]MDD5671349.1 hypothetical protein [Candidatus Omnitrophota bacterium]
MKGNAHNLRVKEQRLLRLYSEWHETHQERVQRQCLVLLGEILAIRPQYNLRREFQGAF